MHTGAANLAKMQLVTKATGDTKSCPVGEQLPGDRQGGSLTDQRKLVRGQVLRKRISEALFG